MKHIHVWLNIRMCWNYWQIKYCIEKKKNEVIFKVALNNISGKVRQREGWGEKVIQGSSLCLLHDEQFRRSDLRCWRFQQRPQRDRLLDCEPANCLCIYFGFFSAPFYHVRIFIQKDLDLTCFRLMCLLMGHTYMEEIRASVLKARSFPLTSSLTRIKTRSALAQSWLIRKV